MSKVRVAVVGVGNCASALVQGVHYYRQASPDDFVPGLMHVDLGGYHVGDVEFSAAFDIDAEKVGTDLGEAIFRGQNNTVKFAEVPRLGVKVDRGMTHDGLGQYLSRVIRKASGSTSGFSVGSTRQATWPPASPPFRRRWGWLSHFSPGQEHMRTELTGPPGRESENGASAL